MAYADQGTLADLIDLVREVGGVGIVAGYGLTEGAMLSLAGALVVATRQAFLKRRRHGNLSPAL